MEEYTLDDAGSNSITPAGLKTLAPSRVSTSCDLPAPSTSANVETVPPCSTSKPDVEDTQRTGQSANTNINLQPSIVYSQDNVDFYVETTPKQVNPELAIPHGKEIEQSTYPWKKEPVIRLRRLSDFDINLWCKRSPDVQLDKYLQVETAHKTPSLAIKQELEVQMPTVVRVKGYGTHAGSKRKLSYVETDPVTPAMPSSSTTETTSTSQLIARANKLIHTVSAALDTLEPIAPPQPSTSSAKPVPVPPSNVPNVETTNQPKRTVHCKLCDFSCSTVRDLNRHHKDDHGIVTCSVCGKNFETKTALDKHMYCHTKKNAFCCEECGQAFPFKSRLVQHQITHTIEPLFKCKHGQCNKGFKNKGDLNRHVKSHSNTWFFCRTCTYRNKDKRNRDSHERTHEAEGQGLERYSCERCGKPMRFSTQRRHHRESGCNPKDLHVQTKG